MKQRKHTTAIDAAKNPSKPPFTEKGRLAQLVEHLVYTERVGGSSPSAPTTFPKSGPNRE